MEVDGAQLYMLHNDSHEDHGGMVSTCLPKFWLRWSCFLLSISLLSSSSLWTYTLHSAKDEVVHLTYLHIFESLLSALTHNIKLGLFRSLSLAHLPWDEHRLLHIFSPRVASTRPHIPLWRGPPESCLGPSLGLCVGQCVCLKNAQGGH